jgi:threonine/homoserine/homoserine lactone efflux protein
MSTEQIVAFALFAFVAAITPGPSNILLASIGATVGMKRGLPSLFGVTLGMGLMITLVALGLGGLVIARPLVHRVLAWGGALLILWLAWKIATAGHHGAVAARATIGFWPAAALQWVNPKSWVVSATAASAYLGTNGNAAGQAFGLGALFVLVAVPSCLVWLAGGASADRMLQSERAAKRFNLVMAALLAGSVLLFLA